jgi:hypothetical protein
VDTLWQCLTSFDRSKEINLSRGQSLSGKNIYRLEKSHFKMESFAISSFAIIEEITSALNFADWHYFCGKMFTFLL